MKFKTLISLYNEHIYKNTPSLYCKSFIDSSSLYSSASMPSSEWALAWVCPVLNVPLPSRPRAHLTHLLAFAHSRCRRIAYSSFDLPCCHYAIASAPDFAERGAAWICSNDRMSGLEPISASTLESLALRAPIETPHVFNHSRCFVTGACSDQV